MSRARRALGTRRIGHAGTLDPFATGLLVMLVGRATRLLPYLDGEPKVYEATIRFGTATDTDDGTGAEIARTGSGDPERVRAAIASLTGEIEQLPPAYSAKQVRGERAYAAARRGTPLELRPIRVTVHEWEVHSLTPDETRVTISCGGGTYIRALARDLGALAGTTAHLSSLRRTHSGPFAVSAAVRLEALAEIGPRALRPAVEALGSLPIETVDEAGALRVARGQTVAAGAGGARAALVDDHRNVLAIAERVGASWQPRVVLAGE